MKLSAIHDIRTEAEYRSYAEDNPDLTDIKLAENFTRKKSLADFHARTARRVVAVAAVFLVVMVAFVVGIGVGTVRGSERSRSAMQTSLTEALSAYEGFESVREMNNGEFRVYIDSSVWEELNNAEKSWYYRGVTEKINSLYRVHGGVQPFRPFEKGMRKNTGARVFFYDQNGTLLVHP
ncbi:MAG: hypothetical protein LIO92_02775 [Clostridiales bacterium]|nr:hypothetical protein [Clostridiales bacterium]